MSGERQHAILSASSAHKWLHCTPSARLEMQMEDTTSESAQEGTLAHSICELKLRKLFIEPGMAKRTYTAHMKKLQTDELYQKEMDKYTDEYVDYIKDLAYKYPIMPFLTVEHRIDFSMYAPEAFGTGDCIMIYGNDLHVIDFKYGKGVPVSANANPQLMLYGLGALAEYSILYSIKTVYLHIVQPRINNTNSWFVPAEDLFAWGGLIKPVAERAYKGEGECVEGPWCEGSFCKVNALCRHRAEKHMELMPIAEARDPRPLSNQEVGDILKKAQFLASWEKKLEGFASDSLLRGEEIPGWKLIEGRSNRAISDIEACYSGLIAHGIDQSLLYDYKPITLTELESRLDKETLTNHVQGYIVKPPGKPTLAPVDDKRPAYQRITAEQAFSKEDKKHE